MNQPSTDQHDLPGYDPVEDVSFRQPPSVMAIAALILGLMSFLALFKTAFWVFPILAIALGASCLVSLARNPVKIGRRAAWIGLLVGLFFMAWASSRYFSKQMWLHRHARAKTEIWLKMIQDNELREAHQLHLDGAQRRKENETLEDYYRDEETAEDDYEGFFSGSPLKEFVEVAPRVTLEYAGFEKYQLFQNYDDFVLRYVAHYEDNGQPQEMVLRLFVRRNVHPMTGQAIWSVYQVEGPKES